jgi:hypothetical protein
MDSGEREAGGKVVKVATHLADSGSKAQRQCQCQKPLEKVAFTKQLAMKVTHKAVLRFDLQPIPSRSPVLALG